MTADRPSNSDLCDLCRHPFGDHWESYDGTKAGCAWEVDDQREQTVHKCKDCHGFAKVYRWNQRPKSGGSFGFEELMK
jgi:hypothetical protein